LYLAATLSDIFFHITNPDTAGCALEIELYLLNINSIALPGTLVAKQTLTPNPDGSVEFFCEDYLNSQLDWELPSLANDNVLALSKQIKKFYIRYRQITKGNPSPAWATEEEHLRTVIKGGIAKEKWDRNNFFINYLPAQKPFLSWLPDKHFIGLEERRYLTYFHDDGDTPALLLKARVVYTDGTQDATQKAFPDLADSLLFHLPAGLQQLGLYGLQPAKQIWYYDVSVEDAGGNVYAGSYRMYADYRKYYNTFSFVYHNSISGMDTLRIRGDYDIELQLNTTDIQQATGGDFSGQILPTENASINISGYKTFDGDAGWMNTRKMQEALEDLLLSDGVYRELFGKRWLRVVNLQKTQKFGSKDDTIWSFPLKWRYTFDNTQFTPFDLDLGAGENQEVAGLLYGTCTAPSNLQVELVEDEPDHKTYTLSWDAVIDAIAYELEYIGPDNIPLTLPLADNHYDLTVFDPGDYTWKVRTKCSSLDYSGFSQGAGFTVSFTALVCTSPAPLTVTLLSIDGSNATVRFSYPAVPGVNGYIIEYREVGSALWLQHYNPQVITLVDKVVLKDVQYECRVRSDCNGFDLGPIVYGPNFIPSNMIGSCGIPSNLQVEVNQHNFPPLMFTFLFTWNTVGDAASYELQFRIKNTSNWTIINPTNAPGSQHAFLPVGGQYSHKDWEWRLRSNCVGGGFSNFINGPDFSTP
jgi:hypothetical protein